LNVKGKDLQKNVRQCYVSKKEIRAKCPHESTNRGELGSGKKNHCCIDSKKGKKKVRGSRQKDSPGFRPRKEKGSAKGGRKREEQKRGNLKKSLFFERKRKGRELGGNLEACKRSK